MSGTEWTPDRCVFPAEHRRLQAENARLRQALDFYAEAQSWAIQGGDDISSASWTHIDIDGGEIARAAIDSVTGETRDDG